MSSAVDEKTRCFGSNDPFMAAYHDNEWGIPVHGDRELFEKLILDAFQAGLSWKVILNKREGFRRAFAGFDPVKVARFGPEDVERLLQDESIVRHRRKIEAAIAGAKACLAIQKEHGSLDEYLWSFTDHQTLKRPPAHDWSEVPTTCEEAKAMSVALKKKGFRFVGPTVCYAFMQAVGMVDDHLATCFRYTPSQGEEA